MALNKSGLPPMKNPMEAAVRPGGPGTVRPGSGKSAVPQLALGSIKAPKLAKGGLIKYPKGMTNIIPKIGKIPTIK